MCTRTISVLTGKGKTMTCKKCLHIEVCGKYQATGGHVWNCKHWMPRLPKEETPKITDQTMDALNKMGEKAHGGNDG